MAINRVGEIIDILPHTFINVKQISFATNQVYSQQRYDNPSDNIITVSINVPSMLTSDIIYKIEQANL